MMNKKRIYIGISLLATFLVLSLAGNGWLYWKLTKNAQGMTEEQDSIIENGAKEYAWPLRDMQPDVPYDTDFDGIDISEHQGDIHWDEMDGDSVKKPQFIYIRANAMKCRFDYRYDRTLREAREHNIPVGSYIFYHNAFSVEDHYRLFCEMYEDEQQDLVPMIDVEQESVGRLAYDSLAQHVMQLAQMIEKKIGTKPIIYSNLRFYRNFLSPMFDKYPLWIAAYGKKPEVEGLNIILWQWSPKGHIKGVWTEVDLDKFINGTTLNTIRLKKKVK